MGTPRHAGVCRAVISGCSTGRQRNVTRVLNRIVVNVRRGPSRSFLNSLCVVYRLNGSRTKRFFAPCSIYHYVTRVAFSPGLRPSVRKFVSMSSPTYNTKTALLTFLGIYGEQGVYCRGGILIVTRSVSFVIKLVYCVRYDFVNYTKCMIVNSALIGPTATCSDHKLLPTKPRGHV